MTDPISIITGAGRGIGAATAKLLAQQGHAVCINYRENNTTAQAVAEAVEGAGGRALVVQADVSREDDVVRLFDTVDRHWGPVTALVNNAAIVMPQTRVADMDAQRINRILTVNVTGYFLCCREAVRRMTTGDGGRGGAIVNVSSVAARTGSPGEYVDYAASKAAVDALTRGLSKEVAALGIRVNAVRPGFIYTEMHASTGEPGRVDRIKPTIPMQRGGQAEEVAHAIAWLLSDQASYATGTFIDLAGGL